MSRFLTPADSCAIQGGMAVEDVITDMQRERRRAIKLHLIDSEEPLTEGTDIIPLCEQGRPNPQPVKHAVFELKLSEDLCRYSLTDMLDELVGICSKCRKLILERRYLYGIREGQAE